MSPFVTDSSSCNPYDNYRLYNKSPCYVKYPGNTATYHCAPQALGIHHITWWRYWMCYWPFVRGIHRSPMNSSHKGQWRGALMFSVICAWINGWVNNRGTGDLRRHGAHYDVVVMASYHCTPQALGIHHIPLRGRIYAASQALCPHFVLCFVSLWFYTGRFYPSPSGSFHWHWVVPMRAMLKNVGSYTVCVLKSSQCKIQYKAQHSNVHFMCYTAALQWSHMSWRLESPVARLFVQQLV